MLSYDPTYNQLLGEVLRDPNNYVSAQTLLSFAQEQNLEMESEL